MFIHKCVKTFSSKFTPNNQANMANERNIQRCGSTHVAREGKILTFGENQK